MATPAATPRMPQSTLRSAAATPSHSPEDREVRVAGQGLSEYARNKAQRERRRKLVRGVIGILAVLAGWQIMSTAYQLDQILPSPIAVAETIFRTLTLTGEGRWLYGPNIYVHLVSSFSRATVGFALACAVAIPMGILIGRFRALREFVDPVIRSLYPIPGIAWIPLAILWFGLGNTAVIFVVFVAEFFPLYFSTEAGVRSINPVLIDAARCYGAKRFTLLRRVVLPAAIPNIITGMRIALGGAWRMIVAGEMLASQTGIGSVLTEARYQFRADDLMMAMVLISIVGYVTERLLVGTLEKKTIQKWEVKAT
jgi:ABC-type nitrate/sulfonate/bicarbonate transport system permease component